MLSGFQQMTTMVTGLLLAGQTMAQNPDHAAVIADDFKSSLKETTVTVTPHPEWTHYFNINYKHDCPKNRMAAHILVVDADADGILSAQNDRIVEAVFSHVTLDSNKVHLKDSISVNRDGEALRYYGSFDDEKSVERFDRTFSFQECVSQIMTNLMLGALPKSTLIAPTLVVNPKPE